MALFQIGFLQVLDASWCLFYAVLCMHALDFGVNWDEGLQTDLGLCTWRQLTSGTNTLEQLRRSQWDIGLFPPLVELLLVAPAVALGAPLLSCRRFGMAMISFIGLLALRRFGASLKRGTFIGLAYNTAISGMEAVQAMKAPKFIVPHALAQGGSVERPGCGG